MFASPHHLHAMDYWQTLPRTALVKPDIHHTVITACMMNDPGTVRQLLERSPWMIDEQQADGATALYIACFFGHVACLYAIFETVGGRCDVNRPHEKGYTPLYIAAHQGHEDCLEVLLQYAKESIIIDQPSWSVTERREHSPIVTHDDPIHPAPEFITITNPSRIMAMIGWRHNVNCARMLLQHVNALRLATSDTYTVLYAALVSGKYKITDMLLRNVVDWSDIDYSDQQGYNISHYISLAETPSHRFAPLVRRCNVNQQNHKGVTPLAYACMEHNIYVINLLFNIHGDRINVNLADHRGNTPLHWALMHPQPTVANLLLIHAMDRIDVNQLNNIGESPLFNVCVDTSDTLWALAKLELLLSRMGHCLDIAGPLQKLHIWRQNQLPHHIIDFRIQLLSRYHATQVATGLIIISRRTGRFYIPPELWNLLLVFLDYKFHLLKDYPLHIH